jgi:hypothetical protein
MSAPPRDLRDQHGEYDLSKINALLRCVVPLYSPENMAKLIAATQPPETHAAQPPLQLEEELTPAADDAAADAAYCGVPTFSSFAAVLLSDPAVP